jgi:hypothetical protein
VKQWSEYSYAEQMTLIADALGVSYWSVSDSASDEVLDLLALLQARGLQAAYVRELAVLCGADSTRMTPEQVFDLIVAAPDVCYHAAARALGMEV